MKDLKQAIQNALAAFNPEALRTSAIGLLNTLGYASDRFPSLPDESPDTFIATIEELSGQPLNRDKALVGEWVAAELLFQLTDDEMSAMVGEPSLFHSRDIEAGRLESYMFFAVRLSGTGYSRGRLSAIARQINRVFPMPVMVLFVYGDTLSAAIINRRPNKKDGNRDVLEKVTLIHGVNLRNPHRGHIDILAALAFSSLPSRRPINSFDRLHAAWSEVFNVDLLNKRFYQRIQEWFFWAVDTVQFPEGGIADPDERNRLAVIRLLTRVVFCWFAREKALVPAQLFDAAAIGRVLKDFDPDSLQDDGYYKAILQNLFFPTLAVPLDQREFREGKRYRGISDHYMDHRFFRHEKLFNDPEDLGRLFASIPFLNGGLFECLDYRERKDGTNCEIRVDGFSDTLKKQPHVPNALFFARHNVADLGKYYDSDRKSAVKVAGLFEILDSYKFTVAENTPVEEEIALDPELLGRMFENLLAEYNPETEKTARKDTGSFYTPRTIVDYMVNESLKTHLKQRLVEKLPDMTEGDADVGLDILFSYTEREHAFTEAEKRVLVDAIYDVTILDPACGSGAFPMGMLQKLVYVLDKLDHGHRHWEQRILDDTPAAIREQTRNMLRDSSPDFQWKLGLIQHCVYGIDIQPIAVQIAKLRCFVSLLVDFQVDPGKDNAGVPALPNLDFKFVAADTLIKPPSEVERAGDLLGLEDPFFAEFAKLAEGYFFVRNPQEKGTLRERIEKLIDGKIAEKEKSVARHRKELEQAETQKLAGAAGRRQAAGKKKLADIIARADREIALWESYRNIFAFRNRHVEFFDTRYFFPECRHGFDIVIGNPPYNQIQKYPATQKARWEEQNYATYAATADIYCLFYERGAELLKKNGALCYITSNKWMRADYGEALRNYLANAVDTTHVLDFGMAQNFGAATTYTCVVQALKRPNRAGTATCYAVDATAAMADPTAYFEANRVDLANLNQSSWVVLSPERHRIKRQVETLGVPLKDWDITINYGIKTGLNEAFYITTEQRDAIVAKEPQAADIIVPLLRGRFVERYGHSWGGTWMINTHNGVKEKGIAPIHAENDYPVLFEHLRQFETKLRKRQDQGDHWTNLRNCAYLLDFSRPKIVYPNMTKYLPFFYDGAGMLFTNQKCFIMTTDRESLHWLTAMMNSVLFRASFKECFPELMGNTYELSKVFFEQIPILRPDAKTAKSFEPLVALVQHAKAAARDGEAWPDAPPDLVGRFLEEVIDLCVMEVYFPDHLADTRLSIIDTVRPLTADLADSAAPKTLAAACQSFYLQANAPEHPIRNRLKRLPIDSPDLLRIIKEEGKV